MEASSRYEKDIEAWQLSFDSCQLFYQLRPTGDSRMLSGVSHFQFQLPSFAKINLWLRILGRRPDGFHELCTVFQTISLCDTISFEANRQLTFTCDDPSVPTDERNLIVRSANALRNRYGVAAGAAIRLEKRIPSPGGLGGGSSNAAVALIGLSRLWNIDLDLEEMADVALEIGSDVPFFLCGGTAIGRGRGELIEPIIDVAAENMLIVTPDVAISTREAFSRLDADALTNSGADSNLTVCRFDAKSFDLLRSDLRNDFEPSVIAAHPEIGRVKQTLSDLGAINVAMCGSGASVFAVFDKTETRQAAVKALDVVSTWRKFAVSTVSRDDYRAALGIT